MSLNCTQGFILNGVKSHNIKSKNAQKCDTGNVDFKNVTIGKNGVIDGNEIMKNGLSSLKLFHAFKGISGDRYSEKFTNNILKDKKDALNIGKPDNTNQIKSFLQPKNEAKVQNSQNVKSTARPQMRGVAKKAKPEPFNLIFWHKNVFYLPTQTTLTLRLSLL